MRPCPHLRILVNTLKRDGNLSLHLKEDTGPQIQTYNSDSWPSLSSFPNWFPKEKGQAPSLCEPTLLHYRPQRLQVHQANTLVVSLSSSARWGVEIPLVSRRSNGYSMAGSSPFFPLPLSIFLLGWDIFFLLPPTSYPLPEF